MSHTAMRKSRRPPTAGTRRQPAAQISATAGANMTLRERVLDRMDSPRCDMAPQGVPRTARPTSGRARPATAAARSRPSTARIRPSTSRSTSRPRTEDDAPWLSERAAERIFTAKCDDLELRFDALRLQRFVESMDESFTRRNVVLKEGGLGPRAGVALAKALAKAPPSLTLLDITGNLIKDAGAVALADVLRKNRSLTRVSLGSNDIGAKGGQAIAQALGVNRTLTSLDLSSISGVNRNHVSLLGAQAIGAMLEGNDVLTELGMAMNGIGPEGLEAVTGGLEKNRTLRVLNLCSNSLAASAARVLIPALPQTRLVRLDLSRNAIGDKGAIALAEVLVFCKGLYHLDLSENGIGEVGAFDLADAIKTGHSGLTTLIMAGNNVGTKGFASFMLGLKGDLRLQTLSLARNNVRVEDPADISDFLAHNRTLTRLDVSKNTLANEGAIGIAACLATATSALVHVDLSSNRIKDDGGVAVAEALSKNSTALTVNLRNNILRNGTGDALARVMETNKTIQSMDIEFNDIDFKSFTAVTRALKANVQAFKDGRVDRYTEEIDALRRLEDKLHAVRGDLRKERRETAELEARAVTARERMDKTRVATDEAVRVVREEYEARVQMCERVQQEARAMDNNISKAKSDGQMRIDGQTSTANQNRDRKNMLEKKVTATVRSIEEFQKTAAAEIEAAEALLKNEEGANAVIIGSAKKDIHLAERMLTEVQAREVVEAVEAGATLEEAKASILGEKAE